MEFNAVVVNVESVQQTVTHLIPFVRTRICKRYSHPARTRLERIHLLGIKNIQRGSIDARHFR